MAKAHDFSTETPIDVKKALETMGGEQKIFYSMLGKLTKMSLDPAMNDIAACINNKDYENMKNKAHSLKGASGYVGAGILHKCCFDIQEAFLNKDFALMVSHYPALVEASIQFKIFSAQIIAKHEGNTIALIDFCRRQTISAQFRPRISHTSPRLQSRKIIGLVPMHSGGRQA